MKGFSTPGVYDTRGQRHGDLIHLYRMDVHENKDMNTDNGWSL